MISFKLLEQYLNNANINLIISKSDDEITVSLLPLPKIKDDAKSNLKPIIIRGTATELDEQFHIIIQKHLEKVYELEQSVTISDIVKVSPNIIIDSIPKTDSIEDMAHRKVLLNISKEEIDELYAEPDNSTESPIWNENEENFNNEKSEPIKPQQETIDLDLETLF